MPGVVYAFLYLYFLSLIGFLAVEVYVCTHPENSDQFSMYSIADAFDPERMSLWRTQAEAFELLYRSEGKRIRVSELRSRYAKCARRFPELYEGVAFKTWLRFLRAEQLITNDRHFIVLTPLGADLEEGLATDGRVVQAKLV